MINDLFADIYFLVEDRGYSVIDATLEVMTKHNLDEEDIAQFIYGKLLDDISREAIDRNLLTEKDLATPIETII